MTKRSNTAPSVAERTLKPKRRTPVKFKQFKWRTAPCGLRHQMDPFFMGLAVAEFLPANPATWFDAAVDADVRFARHDGEVIIEGGKSEADKRRGDQKFLIGWMIGTIGGNEALHDWLAERGIKGVARDGDRIAVLRDVK